MWRALAIAAVGAIVLVAYYGDPVHVIPRGSPIVHDDFVFTVGSVTVLRRAHDATYDVIITVDNRAKRVPYMWRDNIAYVVDDSGRTYQALSHAASEILPGVRAQVRVTFVLPASARRPALRFWDGVLMGDVIDGAQYTKAAVPLY